jgi:hypothetical protein
VAADGIGRHVTGLDLNELPQRRGRSDHGHAPRASRSRSLTRSSPICRTSPRSLTAPARRPNGQGGAMPSRGPEPATRGSPPGYGNASHPRPPRRPSECELVANVRGRTDRLALRSARATGTRPFTRRLPERIAEIGASARPDDRERTPNSPIGQAAPRRRSQRRVVRTSASRVTCRWADGADRRSDGR